MFSINPIIFWFALGFVLLVLEALTPGLFLLFLGLGAWVTCALVYFLPLTPGFQWLIFLAASLLSLFLFRRRVKAFFEGRLAQSDNMPDTVFISQYLDREVEVMREIAPGQPGQVELNGTNWRARSEGAAFAVGQRVRVVKVEGLMLTVAPLELIGQNKR